MEGRCQCREGFYGDGYDCINHCAHDEVWENGKCVPTLFDDRSELPFCDFKGDCACPEGYELSEETLMCHYVIRSRPDDESASEELSKHKSVLEIFRNY